MSERPKDRWLITGGAGFIGSHLVERLLAEGEVVRVLDDFSTGTRENLRHAYEQAWKRSGTPGSLELVHGSVVDTELVTSACEDVRYVLHQAALGSVPRSLEYPRATFHANVLGSFEIFEAARRAKVERVIYASSSSVYGDCVELPQRESRIGNPRSPYAASKRIVEQTADTMHRSFGFPCIGLRYFNVFGPRQNQEGPYAAVIPKWISRLACGEPCEVYGDGTVSRDFCYVENVVSANLLAARLATPEAFGQVFNIAAGGSTSLLVLHRILRDFVARWHPEASHAEPVFRPARNGELKHSRADIRAAQRQIGYKPLSSLSLGLAETVRSFLEGSPCVLP